jgi:nucleotide-binding universal stress UspA family protein
VSIFPTKILLATEGSEEAQLALRVAVELANSTNSQLHLLTVDMPDLPGYVELLEEAYRKSERHGQQTLDEQVKKVEDAEGSWPRCTLRWKDHRAKRSLSPAPRGSAPDL